MSYTPPCCLLWHRVVLQQSSKDDVGSFQQPDGEEGYRLDVRVKPVVAVNGLDLTDDGAVVAGGEQEGDRDVRETPTLEENRDGTGMPSPTRSIFA
ncbi:hypothetical protein L1887_32254 [Cichorium endivia]|nr:hypothetical protein L1887_32254 [Cichorium endivia]